MVVRDSVIFGIPLDPADPSNNAMAPVSGISQGKDIDFDDQEQLVYWVQSTVSLELNLRKISLYSCATHEHLTGLGSGECEGWVMLP